MALDGIMFEGTTLRVRRPNDYNPTIALGSSTPSPNLNLAAIGLGGAMGGMGGGMGMGGMGMGMGGMGMGGGTGNNSENPDRIFVGGLPYMLAEPQVVQVRACVTSTLRPLPISFLHPQPSTGGETKKAGRTGGEVTKE
jgi:splicing factor U2AF subunit